MNAVTPKEVPAPEVLPTGGAPAATKSSSLPPELVKLPAMQAILAGSPPAVSADAKTFEQTPEGKLVSKYRDKLMGLGMGFYLSLDGGTGVMFNRFYLNGEALKQADKEGRLQEVAPPLEAVSNAVASAGRANPVLSATGPTGGFAPEPTMAPPQAATMPLPPATQAQKRIASTRAKALESGPTKGPRPGAGRLINRITQPVV